ncbi:hypothetical protein C9374_003725 [Naegleria lovaniensis]|uniref:Cyclin-like domain-containing protein n=1 Tax=Naegleria lovaniensis TaxID=51637 RepID=A0AA88H5D2_NAELO|nr:uncharacterized protein C9374_003725 [Naegleria lovaniensis]KAG2393961.1 hypothetical protein C9374_003725 [Naegleria lovaniensis]
MTTIPPTLPSTSGGFDSSSGASENATSPFVDSTHRKNWIFSKDQLNEIRNKSLEKVRQQILDLQEKYSEKLSENDLLSPEEESLIVLRFSETLLHISTKLMYPLHVKATALTYLKRFYLKHSIMEYDIVFMMLTCIFLATKTEEKFVALAQFLENVNAVVSDAGTLTSQFIFKNELILLQGLDFNLMVYHPYRSLFAYAHDLHDMYGNDADVLYEGAQQKITELIKSTDTIFLYTPSVIALASLYIVSTDVAKNFISKMFPTQEAQLLRQVEEIKTIYHSSTPEKSKLKAADKKLKKVRKILKPQLEELEERYLAQIAEEQRVKREEKYRKRDLQQQLEQKKFL